MVVGMGGQGLVWAMEPLLASVGGWAEGLRVTGDCYPRAPPLPPAAPKELGGSWHRGLTLPHPKVLWGVGAALCFRVKVRVMAGPWCQLLLTAHVCTVM